MDRMEILHVLVRDHHLSLESILDMTPWQLDIKLIQIQRDLDEKAEKLRKQANTLP